MQSTRLRLLSYIIMAYMLLAFVWWSVLLVIKNRDSYKAKQQFTITMLASEEQFNGGNTPRYNDLLHQLDKLESDYKTQEWMIIGEGIVFAFILLVGIYLVDRGYRKEVASAKQRRNFLLSITHELKSPIASIELVLETFLKRQLDYEAVQKFSKNGLKDTRRLYNLVSDLLLSARLEESYQPHFEEVDLSLLSNELIIELEEKYPNAHFSMEEVNDIPVIKADISGLTSVLLNLLENAIKYSKDNPIVHLRLTAKNNHIQVEIADQGIGIPDKEKKNIFDKFYRVGSEDTRSTKGTGLGLYIVKQILKAHNGSIQVFNNEPTGTVMSLRMPV